MRYQVIIYVVIAVASVSLTRYFFPRIESKTVEVTKDVVHTDIQTIIRTITKPTGEVDSTTTITDHTQHTETSSKSAVVIASPKINISALVGTDLSQPGIKPIYGVSASKEFLGPITLGAYGLTNGVVGISVGFNF